MSTLDKLQKNSKNKIAAPFGATKIRHRDPVPTNAPTLNIALGGALDGGLLPGILMIAGPSKHFKSNVGLVVCSAWMKAHPKSIMLFYDTEFGASEKYFENAGIDPERVFHSPLTDIEQLKFDIVTQLDGFDKTDDVIIFIFYNRRSFKSWVDNDCFKNYSK